MKDYILEAVLEIEGEFFSVKQRVKTDRKGKAVLDTFNFNNEVEFDDNTIYDENNNDVTFVFPDEDSVTVNYCDLNDYVTAIVGIKQEECA